MLRIWINNADARHIRMIDMLKNNPDGEDVMVFVTSPDPASPAFAYADVNSLEVGNATDAVYAEMALEYATSNRIDVVVPTCRVRAFASHRHEFRRCNVEVLHAANDYITDITESRVDLWQVAQKWGINVPPYRRVTSSAEFRASVEAMQQRGFRAVVQPDRGATDNIRVVRNCSLTVGEILGPSAPSILVDEYVNALWNSDFKAPAMVVHPYLDDPEVIIDVLVSPNSYNVVTAIPSRVVGGYLSFGADQVVMQGVHTLVDNLGLSYLSSFRFRHLDGQPVLVGVTPAPRPEVADTLGTGVNLLWEAVRFSQGHQAHALNPNLAHLAPVSQGQK